MSKDEAKSEDRNQNTKVHRYTVSWPPVSWPPVMEARVARVMEAFGLDRSNAVQLFITEARMREILGGPPPGAEDEGEDTGQTS